MARYLFFSHDGFGLGHVRRNGLIAERLHAVDSAAQVTLVTGLPVSPAWLGTCGADVVRVPALVKGTDGAYCNPGMAFEDALAARSAIFATTVERERPDVIVVDRHPYGIGDELRSGLTAAWRGGARLVLGLRDILDEPDRVRAEMTGHGWDGVDELFDEVLVYGGPVLCDHLAEYGLPVPPTYCGWVVDRVEPAVRDDHLVVVAAGGGGDGADVFALGAAALARLGEHRGVILAGPYAAEVAPDPTGDPRLAGRIEVRRDTPGCAPWFARAGASLQMAGYNSTVEALAAGLRPVLMPRRAPRREQAIRAGRLAALGLADVVDEGAGPDEVAWLLQRSRPLPAGALDAAGLRLDGAIRAADRLAALAGLTGVPSRMPPVVEVCGSDV